MISASGVIEEEILDVLESRRSLTIEEVVRLLPWISWRDVFLAVEVLSQQGAIVLRLEGFSYQVARRGSGLPMEAQAGAGS